MATITYKCPNCGGGMIFDPASQKFKCEFCLSDYTQAQLDELQKAGASDQVYEEAVGAEDAQAAEPAEGYYEEPSGEGTDSLRLDRERGSFVIDTPRTSGGFAEEGAVVAGNLRAKISGAPATVWVHSLDGAEIPRSRRLLLTHVTDVQGEGARYSDDSMTTTLKWGTRPLMRNGRGNVAVKHDDAEHCVVYALETSGRRLETIPAEAKDGWLVFTVSVAGPQGARMLYEIAVTR